MKPITLEISIRYKGGTRQNYQDTAYVTVIPTFDNIITKTMKKEIINQFHDDVVSYCFPHLLYPYKYEE
jgi:hypothetical protein